ncbi:hypothetical protein CHU98_g1730 [Xylaria longipes]|nr:hypothetical protein CHU98_g1730 [Xylaria longipes]
MIAALPVRWLDRLPPTVLMTYQGYSVCIWLMYLVTMLVVRRHQHPDSTVIGARALFLRVSRTPANMEYVVPKARLLGSRTPV